MKEVFPRVFIGSLEDANDLHARMLAHSMATAFPHDGVPPHDDAGQKAAKIEFPTHVLSIVSPMEPPPPDFSAKQLRGNHLSVSHVVVYLSDTPTANVIRILNPCCEAITDGRLSRQGTGVLVHCGGAGGSRSAAVAIGFLMTQLGGSLDRAQQRVREAVPHARPNNGFLMQLRLFEMMHCTAQGWSTPHEAYQYLNKVGLGRSDASDAPQRGGTAPDTTEDSMDICVTSQMLRELSEGRWRAPGSEFVGDRYRDHLEQSGFSHGLRRMLSNMAGFLGVMNYSTEEPASQITRTAEIPSATFEGSLMSRRQRKF